MANRRSTRLAEHTSPHDLANPSMPSTLSDPLGKVPSWGRYGLLVITSLLLSSTLFTGAAGFTIGDLSHVSKHLETWWEALGLIAWRAVELGLAWAVGFDGRDVAWFTLLTRIPTYSLLLHFYRVRPTTITASLAIDLISTTIPFILFKRSSSVHDPSKARSNSNSNRDIIQDRPTTLYTSVAAASIFSVILYLSFSTWLPTFLVTHFDGIPDIRTAYAGAAGLPIWILTLLPAGYAARDLLFVSSTGWSVDGAVDLTESVAVEKNPQGEYVTTSVYNKLWGNMSPKTRILISRTVVLATMILLNTVIQVAGTIRGVDVEGATGWGGIWAVAALSIGATFAWIEAVDGV